jgi:hypothetical protein
MLRPYDPNVLEEKMAKGFKAPKMGNPMGMMGQRQQPAAEW